MPNPYFAWPFPVCDTDKPSFCHASFNLKGELLFYLITFDFKMKSMDTQNIASI